jgi:hypothetical protein
MKSCFPLRGAWPPFPLDNQLPRMKPPDLELPYV